MKEKQKKWKSVGLDGEPEYTQCQDLYDEMEEQDKEIEQLKTQLALEKENKEQLEKEAMINKRASIVNNNSDDAFVSDFTRLEDVPKQIRISDYNYAFVQNENASGRFASIGLWVWSEDNWVEVTDLTGICVFEYKTIHKYAVAIGWIDEDKDLFI